MHRVATFTSLYPNAVRPQHGVFVEHRLRRVVATGAVDARVIAPVPWFPLRGAAFGEWGAHAAVPAAEVRHGIPITHPRWLAIPKVGMRAAPGAVARAGRRALRELRADGFDFDLIDAHYFYPDGVAAIRLGAALGRPVVITARGSDVNLIPRVSAHARAAVVDAARRAAAVIVVSDALRSALLALGAPADRIHVIRNGVDRDLFTPPSDAGPATGRRVLSVGSLTANKGHHLVIEAIAQLPDTTLTIAGRGPMHAELAQTAERLGVADRVTFAGSVDQAALRGLYGSADALVLASEMEGLPNVLLEALACGTPVLATSVGGIPEVVTSPDAGALLPERSAAAIAATLPGVLDRATPRDRVRSTTDAFDWGRCASAVVTVFEAAIRDFVPGP